MKLEEFRNVVRKIPRGRTMTYGEVASAAGYPGAARQVVWALQESAPDVPWHRVVGAGGRIRLPGEAGLEQRIRLEAEGVRFSSGRVKTETTAIKKAASKRVAGALGSQRKGSRQKSASREHYRADRSSSD